MLSKWELHSIHIPLVKDFWFKEVEESNIEKWFIMGGKSKSMSSMTTINQQDSTCCVRWAIF